MAIPVLTVPDKELVLLWLIDMLSSKLPTGQKCGNHRAEPVYDTNQKVIFPFLVAHMVPGGSQSGPPLGAAQADATYVFQVDSVAMDPGTALAMSSRVNHWVAGRTAAGVYAVVTDDPDGIRISDRIGSGSPGAPLLEGSPPTEVYTVSDLFEISVSVS